MPDQKHFRVLRKRLFTVTLILSIAIVGSFLLAAWSFKLTHDASRKQRAILCEAQNQSNDAVRRVLLLAESISITRRDLTPDERERSANFYRGALKLVDHVPCSTAH